MTAPGGASVSGRANGPVDGTGSSGGPVTTVALVISHMNMGGTQRQLVNLALSLDRSRWRPVVVCFGPDTPLLARLREAGIETALVRKRGHIDPTLIPRLALCFRRMRPGIVHTFLRTANLWGRAAALVAGVPHLVAAERSSAYRTGRVVRLASRWLGRRTDLVIANSTAGVPYAAEHHAHLPPRVLVIPNGVELPDSEPAARAEGRRALLGLCGWEEPVRVVAMIANLLPEKRVADAVDLAALMKAEHPDVRWVVFGEGGERPALEERIRRRGVEGVFRLAGSRDDLKRLVPACEALLQTSSREGLPNAVLEGMASGIPVVATDVGGTAEALGAGDCGLLVSVGDLEGIGTALGRVLDETAGRPMGEAARRRIERRFSLDSMARATAEGYTRRCLDRGGMPRVAVVVSRYSERSTFIARELDALRTAGVDLAIFSLLPPEMVDGSTGARLALKNGVEYLPFLPGPWDLLSILLTALRRPVRSLAALGTIVAGQIASPRVLVKCLAVWPKMLLLAARARRLRVDAIHAHWATVSATAGMAAARVAGVPFSFSGHAWDLYFDNALLGRKLKAARFVAVCNRHSGEYLERRFPDQASKVVLLYHGLDLDAFDWRPPIPPPAEGEPLRILAIGRLVPKKGFDALIRACGLLRREGVALECTILGEGGPERESLGRLAEEEAGDVVEFARYLPERDLVAVMRSAHLLAAPSVVQTDGAMDGIPNVVIESMATGLPVVTTAVAGIPEIATDGETALVVPGSDPPALARAIRRLGGDASLRQRLSRQARETVERKFEISITTRTLASLLAVAGQDLQRQVDNYQRRRGLTES